MRTLSKAAQSARTNGYGTLKQFREVSASTTYKIAALAYDRKQGLAIGSSLKATSKFARRFGKAFYKDGKLRKSPPPSYLKQVQEQSVGEALQSATSFEDY